MKAQDFAEELRAAAEWWEQHPDVPAPEDVTMNVWVTEREAFAAVARQVGHAEKSTSGGIYWLRARLTDTIQVDFNVPRSTICERRVVGITRVPAQVVEEHDEEVVEWDCGSIFTPSTVGRAPETAAEHDPQGVSGPTS